MHYNHDGLLVHATRDEGRVLIAQLRIRGYHYGVGHSGKGLYSPTWDRQMGELDAYGGWVFNPSVVTLITTPKEFNTEPCPICDYLLRRQRSR